MLSSANFFVFIYTLIICTVVVCWLGLLGYLRLTQKMPVGQKQELYCIIANMVIIAVRLHPETKNMFLFYNLIYFWSFSYYSNTWPIQCTSAKTGLMEQNRYWPKWMAVGYFTINYTYYEM